MRLHVFAQLAAQLLDQLAGARGEPRRNLHRDFDQLIATAHALGLKVMIDLVLSHTSDQHPWFAESRKARTGEKADWYVWADPKPDGTPPNNWLSIFGGSACAPIEVHGFGWGIDDSAVQGQGGAIVSYFDQPAVE